MPVTHPDSRLPPVAELLPSSISRIVIFGPKRRLSSFLRSGCLALALTQMWLSRGVMDPDGVSYSDLAKALLKGDWHNGLSSYWSPLYSWFLAIGYAIFRPGIHWLIFISHVINFIGFAASLAAWEWLLREWERWKGPPAHRTLIEVTGYAVIAWAGLHLVTLVFTSADMEVMALVIALGVLLLRVRSGVARRADFICIGLALGVAFLAKAATLSLVPIVLLELGILLGTWRDRRLYISAALACLVPLPFIVALSIAKGHFVVNDTGRLNYSWEITGMSVEGYKDNAYWPGAEARHPITRLMDVPRVIGYEKHPVGTSPVHFDPAWWSEGYPVRLDLAQQLMVLRSSLGYCITRFAMCPALWFAIVCCLCGAAFRMSRAFANLWFIWLPALAAIGSYCLIYVSNRYLGGPFALLGFCLIAAGWNVPMPRWISAMAPVMILVLFAAVFRAEAIDAPRMFVQAIRGKEDPLTGSEMRIAETMRQQFFRPGDKVGLVGNGLLVAWLHLLDGVSVASVPMTLRHDDRAFGRPLRFTFEKSDAFWRGDPRMQQQVFDIFRKEGAKWIFACNVPIWADVSGWQTAGVFLALREKSKPYMYFRRLD